MAFFNKLNEPIFLKESSSAKEQIEQLNVLLERAPNDFKSQIEQDFKTLSYGIYGEDLIAFELKNSHMPMYVLHDLFLTDNDLTAQIDYLVITRKVIFVIECKNLYGNIEINENDDFIRTIYLSGKYKKEGIYSPITQNQRHLALLKALRIKSKTNIITRALFQKYFDDMYSSVVVLSNPKTILNVKLARDEIKNNVIRADQLINYINETNKKSTMEPSSDKQMEQIANYFLDLHSENQTDYLKKYQDLMENLSINNDSAESKEVESKEVETNNTNIEILKKELKSYRLKTAKEENYKPYFIFSDKQLDELMKAMPKSIDELKEISGFGEVKCSKYGSDIIAILDKWRDVCKANNGVD